MSFRVNAERLGRSKASPDARHRSRERATRPASEASPEGPSVAEQAYLAWCRATGKTPTPRPAPALDAGAAGRPPGGPSDGRRSEAEPDWILLGGTWQEHPLTASARPTPAPAEHPFTDGERASWSSVEARATAARWREAAERDDALAQARAEIAADDAAAAAHEPRRSRDAIDEYVASLVPGQASTDLADVVDAYLATLAPERVARAAQEKRAHVAERAAIDARWADANAAARRPATDRTA